MLLYKYVSADRFDIFENSQIRLTQPSDLNDPFDCAPSFSLMSQDDIRSLPTEVDENGREFHRLTPEWLSLIMGFSVAQLRPTSDENSASTRSLSEPRAIAQHFDQRFGILSLTENFDNLLMWAHYAGNHSGLVLELNSDHTFFQGDAISPGIPRLSAVEYSDVRPVLSLSTIYHPAALLRKSAAWSYEREWRLIRPLEEASFTADRARPNLDIKLFDLPPDAITRVFFGLRIPLSVRERVVDIVNTRPDFSHVSLHYMQATRDTYAIIPNPPLSEDERLRLINGEVLNAPSFRV